MQPASSTIVINCFAPGERGKAMGIYVGIPMAFLALGPLIGGALTELISWRACFLVNLPVAALAIALTIRARPRDGERTGRRVSPAAALLYLAGLPTLVFGLQQWGVWSFSPVVLASIAVGLALVVLFVATEWRRAQPLLAVRLFEERGFLGDGIVLFCMQFAMTGQILYLSTAFQSGLGFSPSGAGAALLPMLLPVIVVVQIAGRVYDRRGARLPVLFGTSIAAAGLAVQALTLPGGRYLPIAAGLVLFGLGIGLVMSPTNTDALSRVGAAARAQASGLLGTLRQVGGSAGIALVGATVLAWQGAALRGAGLAEMEAVAAAARGDAASLAALADAGSADLLDAARDILLRGTAAGQWVACASILAALLAAALLVDGTPPTARREDRR
jgi:predicted MFS family arabinose efflux permease